jgi:hypothetical protein
MIVKGKEESAKGGTGSYFCPCWLRVVVAAVVDAQQPEPVIV